MLNVEWGRLKNTENARKKMGIVDEIVDESLYVCKLHI